MTLIAAEDTGEVCRGDRRFDDPLRKPERHR
jgi:hypothetical protein